MDLKLVELQLPIYQNLEHHLGADNLCSSSFCLQADQSHLNLKLEAFCNQGVSY